MKKIISGALFCIGIGNAMAGSHHVTTDGRLYANQITARNIGAFQQSISTAVFGASDYYAVHIGHEAPSRITRPDRDISKKEDIATYGTLPIYGSAPLYGEWNDDGSITGRNGGDTFTPKNFSVWLRWTHGNTNEKFEDFKELNNRTDLIIGGIGGNRTKVAAGYFNLGAFAGHIDGRQRNKYIHLDEKGGFLGLYAAYNISRARTVASFTVGKIDNEMPYNIGGGSYDNTWIDASAETTYDILLDYTFTLQPGLRIGYTWVKSGDYAALEHIHVTNDNFSLFLISPQINAIKNIGNGWFGKAHFRYAFRKDTGGDIHTSADAKVRSLDTGNYIEYGLGLEKTFRSLNASVDINRQDGARRGWVGGAHLKYVF